MVASASLSTTVAAPPSTTISPTAIADRNQNDVSIQEREQNKVRIRTKNEDIFQVKHDCGETLTDFTSYTDEIDVADVSSIIGSLF